ncbi:hypothetical protein DEO72_LG2g3126 [Vigna unguiculata]|uniref:Uncharacterized protein n=1 Tax=Vigna unguiculata TaxID=3917 RepID=A0A4D6L2U3_VIGUN|nr:hypothetical protein DEO72_LG2g3126 [Vigna unguiculata]
MEATTQAPTLPISYEAAVDTAHDSTSNHLRHHSIICGHDQNATMLAAKPLTVTTTTLGGHSATHFRTINCDAIHHQGHYAGITISRIVVIHWQN